MSIGAKMRERRKFLKISADELGKKLGKDRSTIYRYENGDIESLPMEILGTIATALETTPAYLMGWEEKPTPTIDVASLPPSVQEIVELCRKDPKLAEDLLYLARRIKNK